MQNINIQFKVMFLKMLPTIGYPSQQLFQRRFTMDYFFCPGIDIGKIVLLFLTWKKPIFDFLISIFYIIEKKKNA